MESPPKSNDAMGSLHHRFHSNNHDRDSMTPSHKNFRYETNDYDDESPQHRVMRQRAVLSPHNHHAIEKLHDKHYKAKNKFCASFANRSTTRVVRWSFGIVLSFYLLLLKTSTYHLRDPTVVNRDVSNAPDAWDLNNDCYTSSRLKRGTECQRQTPSWYQEQWKQIEDASSKREARRNQRRDRTKLPSSSKIVGGEWHRVLSLDKKNTLENISSGQGDNNSPEESTGDIALASVDNLCGITAKNSSLVSPQSYPTNAALNKKSRVVITGVLNPVGLALALRLKQECGVQHVMGVDAMYPNTVLNRLLLQDRIKLLNSEGVAAAVKPVVLPFFGLDPKTKASSNKNSEEAKKKSLENEMSWMRNFKPTHVVHLASYSMDVYNDALSDPKWGNTHSPYVSADSALLSADDENWQMANPYFYPLRSGMVSMEQLLHTITEIPEKEQPQFLYASNPTKSNNPLDKHDVLFHAMKSIDELLADVYHSQNEHGLPSIGLRLPISIYGPWGHAGSTTHDILVRSIEERSNKLELETILSNEGRTTNERSDNLDLLFVDDAVDTIISALQYRSDKPTTVTVPSERTITTEDFSLAVQSLLRRNVSDEIMGKDTDKIPSENSKEQSLILPKTEQTPLKYGLAKSIAWHIDRLSPFGTPPTEDVDVPMDTEHFESGDEFLQRHEVETCEPHDIDCHKNNNYLPCSSECNIHQKCVPSIFDETRELVYDVSEGCEIVMYTQMLGYNVEDAELVAEYMDDGDLSDDELLVCNFAFVPRESDLVSLVTGKVPSEQLAKFGIEPRASDRSRKDLRERTLDTLNGRLLYRGWILIWVKDGMRELSTPDASLMKLSPSKFFHPSVKYGLFVEENFKVSPNLDDVLFLVDQMHRRKLETRSLKKEEKTETPHGTITKKIKINIPEEPQRQAAILLAPLRVPNIDDPIVKQYREGDRKLTILRASKFMGYEVGYQPGEKESPSLRRQREFYERIPTFINKNAEMRSKIEPWYRFSPKHWIRSRWVLHDFTLEEARLLRCDWYQEHVQWGNDLDQLSFAKVMGMRDLKRRIIQQEPDDHVKSLLEERPELHDLTDFYEWHSLGTDVKELYREPVRGKPGAGDYSIDETPLSVRIMSERVMDISRKIWNKMKKKEAKAKRERAEI